MDPQINSQRCVLAIAGLVCAATVTDVLTAQWVSFADDTAFRLLLDAFADNPAGDPMDDNQEKDVAVGDLNRDGWDDLIVVRKQPFSTPGARQDVLLLNENGVLVDRTAEFAPGFIATLTDARDVLISELTGDDWPDVIIVNTFWQQPMFYRNLGNNEMGNWLGLVDESSLRFPTIEVANLPGPQFCAVHGGDVTGNGAMDLFFSNYAMSGGTTDVLLINDGSGHFTDETAQRLGSYANVAFGTAVHIQDMDNDGDNDIVKISTLYSVAPFDIGVFILFNNGAGVFNALPFQEPANTSPYYFAVGDLDGNGMLDIFVEQDPQDQVNLATSVNPDGPITYSSFTLSSSPRTNGFGGNTKLADVDNDGGLDVGVAPIDVDIQNCGPGSQFALLRNPGDGHVFDPWPANDSRNIHIDAHDFGFIDVNNDGCMDIFMGLCIGWRVFIQENCVLPCPWDLDDSGDVGVKDLLFLLGAWGPCPPKGDCPADFDASGDVGVKDLLSLLGAWGPCP
ncbi:MAG: VCBS repeat-containing protein [Planctomycetes bacterium]|nr:VCBS repeat-containing protein [Planctomycetota bacterium]